MVGDAVMELGSLIAAGPRLRSSQVDTIILMCGRVRVVSKRPDPQGVAICLMECGVLGVN